MITFLRGSVEPSLRHDIRSFKIWFSSFHGGLVKRYGILASTFYNLPTKCPLYQSLFHQCVLASSFWCTHSKWLTVTVQKWFPNLTHKALMYLYMYVWMVVEGSLINVQFTFNSLMIASAARPMFNLHTIEIWHHPLVISFCWRTKGHIVLLQWWYWKTVFIIQPPLKLGARPSDQHLTTCF